MPVRSSLCTYSPMAASSAGSGAMPGGRNSSSSSSKYSSILPTSSSLSYGLYKPLTSTNTSSYSSPSSSSSSSATLDRYSRYKPPSAYVSPPSGYTSACSSYSPSSTSSSSSTGSSSGCYKPLSSTRSHVGPSWRNTPADTTTGSSRYSTGASPRFSSSSSSTGSLTSTSSSGSDHLGGASASALATSATTTAYQPLKTSSGQNSLSSSAYSSGSSLSSTSSTGYTSPYSSLRQSRRFSTTVQDHHHHQSLPPDAPSGLINLGNTCYMNASLQALYSLESFRDFMLSSSASRHSDRVLTNELAELFKLMRESSSAGQNSKKAPSAPQATNSHQPTSPASFKFAFSRHQTKFSGFGQQDAQEFLRYLIDGIHEECNAASKRPRRQRRNSSSGPRSAHEAWAQYRDIVDDSPLVDMLVGQLCSTITCSECHNKSHCWDPFWDLSLPLQQGNRNGGGRIGSASSSGSLCSWRSITSAGSTSRLADVIEEFTAKEVLDSGERPNCSQCKKPTKSTKQISLARLPRVLILHLKKFTNDGYKLTSPEIQIDKQLTFNNGSSQYQLKAAISHHGHSSSSGHYTSHCEYASKWLHFDDGRVRDVTASFDCGKLDDAYVLFYTQQTPRRPSAGGH